MLVQMALNLHLEVLGPCQRLIEVCRLPSVRVQDLAQIRVCLIQVLLEAVALLQHRVDMVIYVVGDAAYYSLVANIFLAELLVLGLEGVVLVLQLGVIPLEDLVV